MTSQIDGSELKFLKSRPEQEKLEVIDYFAKNLISSIYLPELRHIVESILSSYAAATDREIVLIAALAAVVSDILTVPEPSRSRYLSHFQALAERFEIEPKKARGLSIKGDEIQDWFERATR
jgi:hypothetical protein